MNILITDASHPAAEAVRRRLEADGHTVTVNGEDISEHQGIKALIARTGAADGLVITGHSGARCLLGEGDSEKIIAAADRNIRSAFFAARHYGALMVEKGGGSIVFLSSVHADKPTGANPAYSISQGALHMMMRELALFYGHQGVRVNMVKLGPLPEEMGMFDSDIVAADYDLESKIPLGRSMVGSDAAEAIAFLLSGAARGMNGAELAVDGGQLLHYLDRQYTCRREAEL